jgi:hypothetical protein
MRKILHGGFDSEIQGTRRDTRETKAVVEAIWREFKMQSAAVEARAGHGGC